MGPQTLLRKKRAFLSPPAPASHEHSLGPGWVLMGPHWVIMFPRWVLTGPWLVAHGPSLGLGWVLMIPC